MKAWWLNLSIREKQTVALGLILISMLFIYAGIWIPLHSSVSTLREQVKQNQALLIWMQKTDQQIQSISPISSQKKPLDSKSLLSRTEAWVKKSAIAKDLSQLRQEKNNAVQLNFKEVDFDQLIAWLSDSRVKQGLAVTEISVKPIGKSGRVSVTLSLATSNLGNYSRGP